ncbi:MAG: IPT/TIG domain-containing protein [Chloroflexota bacterium]|nr:IPT/TIG domain-containing protein [Chloroflexota bacterium]
MLFCRNKDLAICILVMYCLMLTLGNLMLVDTSLASNGVYWGTANSGNTKWISSVWGSSGSDVFAVGDDGTILHYNGSSWTSMDSGTTEWLYSVWGASSSSVFVAGGDGSVLYYDGSNWSTLVEGPQSYQYESIWGSSASDVFGVGSDGTVMHYDGSAWSPMSSGITQTLFSVWGISSMDVFAVGDDGIIIQYDGSSWSTMTGGSESYWLEGIWGSSGSDVFAVGSDGVILHYNGTAWSSMVSGIDQRLMSVWGSSSSDVFAVSDEGAVLHYDGSSWSPMTSGTTNLLECIWGSSRYNVFAVGRYGTILHYTEWDPPTIISFAPTEGTTGDSVVISGTNFQDVNAVRFGVTDAESFTGDTPVQITAVLGDGSDGYITVTTPGGIATSSETFEYYPRPVIASFTPASGDVGATVVITGEYFTEATAVTFGDIDAASFIVDSDTQITAVVGNGYTGSIKVTTLGGTGTSNEAFTVTGLSPIITEIDPNSEERGKSIQVVITGDNFSEGIELDFGSGVTINSITIDSSTRMTVDITIADAAKRGPRIVSATTALGKGSLDDGFTVKSAGELSVPTWAWIMAGAGGVIIIMILFLRMR